MILQIKLEKEQKKLYKSNIKLEEERNQLFDNLDESPDIIEKKLQKIENVITDNNNRLIELKEEFTNCLNDFNSKQEERNSVSKEKRVEEKNYMQLIQKTANEINEINKEMVESLKLLEPYGEGNKMPIFAFRNLKIDSIRALSEGKHIKLTLKDNNNIINAIGFNLGKITEDYRIGDKIDVVGTLEINSFNGVDSLQINIKDVMKSI